MLYFEFSTLRQNLLEFSLCKTIGCWSDRILNTIFSSWRLMPWNGYVSFHWTNHYHWHFLQQVCREHQKILFPMIPGERGNCHPWPSCFSSSLHHGVLHFLISDGRFCLSLQCPFQQVLLHVKLWISCHQQSETERQQANNSADEFDIKM